MLIAKAKDPAFWGKVRTSDAYAPMRDELLSMWEKDCTGDIPACKYTEFIIFKDSGRRKEYENSYFARRRALNTAALLSLIYPDEVTYKKKLWDIIWAILDEYTWVLPAHMPTFAETRVDFIDLFAAETSFALAEIDYLLEDALPPLIRSRLRAEIDRRVIHSYLQAETPFWWEKARTNWAAVCAGSVCAAFLYTHPEHMDEVLPRVQDTLRDFLSGFTEDGICLEGLGYWHYGFGFFMCIADLLREYTDGKINYFADPKVKKIAAFAQSMYLGGSSTVSFSDSARASRYHIGLLHYLRREYGDEIHLPPRSVSYTNDRCGRWGLHLRALLWFDENAQYSEIPEEYTLYAPHAQWLIKLMPSYSFAAKGGRNNEPHNHNDLGSFIIVKDGRQILCDLGSGTYNRDYFSGPTRYLNLHASSRGHSVPVINGIYQKAGAEHTADSTFADGVFTIEFHRGYVLPALTSLTRRFSFGDDAVTLEDTYAYDGVPESFVERFVSVEEPEIFDGYVKIGPLTLIADMDAVASVTMQTETEKHPVWMLDYTLKPEARSFRLKIQA